MRNLTQLDWLEEYLKANEIPYKRVDEEYPDYGVGFEENGDMDGLVAWMPKPKPYKGEGENNEDQND